MFLNDQLDHWAKHTPQAGAVVFQGKTISFAELKSRVDGAAQLLAKDYEVVRGDRVAWLGLNHPDMLVLVFACAQMGAIFNPLNSRLALAEYNYLLTDASPKVCFFDQHFVQTAEEVSKGDCQFASSSTLEKTPSTNHHVFDPLTHDCPLLLVYTSGTTGRPKGVVLSQDAVAANIDNCQSLYGFKPDQNIQITLPLFHVGGLCILLLPALTHGATIFFHERFDPVATLKEIEQETITTSIFVPAQMAAMMALPDWQSRDLSSMAYVAVGSSIIPLQQIKNFHDRGIPVSQVYGATETGPAAIALEVDQATSQEGSAGTPVKLCKVEVRTVDGRPCSDRENGEIWVSGPNILSGYWMNETETDKVLVDGWYNTGDIGHRDSNGYYWIVDRSKDVIISGGENIYPAEIEACLQQHPAIAAVAVVGRADDRWGEVPVAAVELHENEEFTFETMTHFLQNRIARYKFPKSLMPFSPLPRNAMGKIEKPVLRQLIADEGEQL